MKVQIDLSRARGIFWGHAIGDALGASQEFGFPRNRRPFPQLNLGPQTDIVGGGPFGLEPGQTTDDTQMAVCLAESLVECRGFDAQDIASRYLKWMDVAFDVGNQTRAALTKIRQGLSALEAGLVIWEAARRLPAGNGSLMRISPLAVYFADDPLALRQAALDDSAITHADPRCRLACAAFVAAARHALVSPNATTESMHCAAAEELRTAVEYLGPRTPSEYSKQAVAALSEDLELATRSDPHLESRAVHLYRTAGFVRVAFRIAFWELLHAPDFMACVLDCTNRGGDADTNAAIAGALYGALVGESQIPGAWRERVHNCCRGGRPKNPPLMDEYHPRRLFRVMQKFDASNIAAPSTAG